MWRQDLKLDYTNFDLTSSADFPDLPRSPQSGSSSSKAFFVKTGSPPLPTAPYAAILGRTPATSPAPPYTLASNRRRTVPAGGHRGSAYKPPASEPYAWQTQPIDLDTLQRNPTAKPQRYFGRGISPSIEIPSPLPHRTHYRKGSSYGESWPPVFGTPLLVDMRDGKDSIDPKLKRFEEKKLLQPAVSSDKPYIPGSPFLERPKMTDSKVKNTTPCRILRALEVQKMNLPSDASPLSLPPRGSSPSMVLDGKDIAKEATLSVRAEMVRPLKVETPKDEPSSVVGAGITKMDKSGRRLLFTASVPTSLKYYIQDNPFPGVRHTSKNKKGAGKVPPAVIRGQSIILDSDLDDDSQSSATLRTKRDQLEAQYRALQTSGVAEVKVYDLIGDEKFYKYESAAKYLIASKDEKDAKNAHTDAADLRERLRLATDGRYSPKITVYDLETQIKIDNVVDEFCDQPKFTDLPTRLLAEWKSQYGDIVTAYGVVPLYFSDLQSETSYAFHAGNEVRAYVSPSHVERSQTYGQILHDSKYEADRGRRLARYRQMDLNINEENQDLSDLIYHRGTRYEAVCLSVAQAKTGTQDFLYGNNKVKKLETCSLATCRQSQVSQLACHQFRTHQNKLALSLEEEKKVSSKEAVSHADSSGITPTPVPELATLETMVRQPVISAVSLGASGLTSALRSRREPHPSSRRTPSPESPHESVHNQTKFEEKKAKALPIHAVMTASAPVLKARTALGSVSPTASLSRPSGLMPTSATDWKAHASKSASTSISHRFGLSEVKVDVDVDVDAAHFEDKSPAAGSGAEMNTEQHLEDYVKAIDAYMAKLTVIPEELFELRAEVYLDLCHWREKNYGNLPVSSLITLHS